MAIMIPMTVDREKTKQSKEDLPFYALKKYLPDDYHVYHSLKFYYWGKRKPDNEKHDSFHEHEADFIIFNKDKGILVIETKRGEDVIAAINPKTGEKYPAQRGVEGENAYNQAADIKWDLLAKFSAENIESLKQKCKICHAVWFIFMKKSHLDNLSLGASGCKEITITNEYLNNGKLQQKIDELFDMTLEQNKSTNLTQEEFEKIERKIFNPLLAIYYNEAIDIELEEIRMDNLLEEQYNILNFLEEQNSAIISGIAGTGKTYIALHKARKHSIKNEKVLFLCYNKRLANKLRLDYKNDPDMCNVDFRTLDSLCRKWCGDKVFLKDKYKYLKIEINNRAGNFPYRHIIIDEGQDFGRRLDENENLTNEFDSSITSCIDCLSDAVLLDETKHGSFYLFYDKHQLVHCTELPKYIKEAECKLTLHTNCRNTENIAKTATASLDLKNQEKKVLKNNIGGQKPVFYISTTEKDTRIDDLENVLKECINNKIINIQILSCKTIDHRKNSFLWQSKNFYKVNDDEKDDTYAYKFNNKIFDVTTCRKFKGLEAQAVILVDVDKDVLINNYNIFYVGASRAKSRLFVIAKLEKEDFELIRKAHNISEKRNIQPETRIKVHFDIDIK